MLRSGAMVVLVAVAAGCRGATSRPPPAAPRPEARRPAPRPAARPVKRDRRPAAKLRLRLPVRGKLEALPDDQRPRGIVIVARAGAPVCAAAAGQVSYITTSYPGVGPAIVVTHPGGYQTFYGPVRCREGLAEKQAVGAGAALGVLASATGETWARLRFRLMHDGVDVPDILGYLEVGPAPNSPQ